VSSNNFISIQKIKDKYVVDDRDMEFGSVAGIKIGEFDTLEEAIKEANKYQKENEVEYGLSIKGI